MLPPRPRVTFVNTAGEEWTVAACVDESVMEVAKRNEVPGIRADCGGFMNCGTCHVYVDVNSGQQLSPTSELEDDLLDGVVAPRRAGSRLSCQMKIEPLTDLRVTIPERQI